jgi:hypothetical protein
MTDYMLQQYGNDKGTETAVTVAGVCNICSSLHVHSFSYETNKYGAYVPPNLPERKYFLSRFVQGFRLTAFEIEELRKT